jgi:hypothetical protein
MLLTSSRNTARKYTEVRAAYIDTMNKVNAKIRTFQQDRFLLIEMLS